jgi:hypothetical protein
LIEFLSTQKNIGQLHFGFLALSNSFKQGISNARLTYCFPSSVFFKLNAVKNVLERVAILKFVAARCQIAAQVFPISVYSCQESAVAFLLQRWIKWVSTCSTKSLSLRIL